MSESAAATNNNSLLSGYLTEREMAAQLGISRRTLRQWRAVEAGPPRTIIGRKIYYRADAAADWLRSRQEAAGDPGRI